METKDIKTFSFKVLGSLYRAEKEEDCYLVQIKRKDESGTAEFKTALPFIDALFDIIHNYGLENIGKINGSELSIELDFNASDTGTKPGGGAANEIINIFSVIHRVYRPDYKDMTQRLKALTDGIPHFTANAANAAAIVFNTLEYINWAGFYFMENGKLVLNAFQGKPACIEIAVGRGVCGTAVAKDEIQLVYDVHKFPGHIACDPDSRSEIVIPIHKNGAVFGVLDIDAPYTYRFTEYDAEGLTDFVQEFERII